MQMPAAVSWPWLFLLLLFWPTDVRAIKSEDALESLLSTENCIIDELRVYINKLEQQLVDIKSEVAVIEEIHGQVGEQVEEHMGNPLNVLTILKRFESVWPGLEQKASDINNLTWSDKYYAEELELPTEADYESALGNLLHLQSVYDLEPASLSLGLVNGQKFGSAMSWSDCLEMAIKSEQKDNANYAVAKYWLETALNKMTPINNTTDPLATEQERGKVRILEFALNLEYRAGEYSRALATADKLLLLRPTHQSVRKAKAKIELAMSKLPPGKQRNAKAKKAKSAEQQLEEELCREAMHQTISGAASTHCQLDRSKPTYLLQPLHLEILSTDPYIALHHNVLTAGQTDQLIELMDEDDLPTADESSFDSLHFSKLAQKKLSRLCQHQVGQFSGFNINWEARRHGHHNVLGTVGALHSSALSSCTEHEARVMLNLQPAKMGGAVVFPQLQLGINVPHGSLLYWRTCNRNEFSMDSETDYRSRHTVCPVVLGEQLSAWTKLM